MISRGEYRSEDKVYGLILNHSKDSVELIVINKGNVWSGYKSEGEIEYSYNNMVAKSVWLLIKGGLVACKAKNSSAMPFKLGTISRHIFSKQQTEYVVDKYNNEIAGVEIVGKGVKVWLEYSGENNIIPVGIPYTKLTTVSEFKEAVDSGNILTRSLEEISLEKDITWLKGKKYYVVNDDMIAEKIFDAIEKRDGPVSYDTETTGLKINMFSKINSKWAKQLEEYNSNKADNEKIRADRLVGIIFCVKENESYYFPCYNRKFKNLYVDGEIREKLITRFKMEYTVGDKHKKDGDMARYWRETNREDISSDCILMERCRKILETKSLIAHNGSFEWKVSWCYDIDINLKEDTMILHQLMYKFRSTTSNRGEPSNLKYLAKREFNIDQLDLGDFFVDYKEDTSGLVRTKGKSKKNSTIDFSYMDYNGTRAYAPADGDITLMLYHKYKRDMLENHKEMSYIYNVEMVVSCAIGYMEFYGLRIDERKINEVRDKNRIDMMFIEHDIRKLAKVVTSVEEDAFKELSRLKDELHSKGLTDDLKELIYSQIDKCREILDSGDNVINLASPSQVGKLFFETLGYPHSGDKVSVAKKEIKPLLKMKNEDGSNKYPAVHLYSEWKKLDTLLTKFFDNLQSYMYPGGFMFASYGQISTATGRMSCSKPR